MELLSSVSIPAIVGLVVLIIFIILIAFFLKRKNKSDKTVENLQNPLQSAITPTPVKSSDTKYLILIVLGSIVAIIIPFIALVIVRSQPTTISSTTQENVENTFCRAITITDTLNNPLSQDSLVLLRPGDEVKILIATEGTNVEKARFRINGSGWQEVTLKSGNNFIGNYILDGGFNKFTIEAEVFDKDKGWL